MASADMIPINHKDECYDDVPRINLFIFLIMDRAKILLVGEGDFTFTLAYAACRQSKKTSYKPWEGITSTRYEPVGPVGEVQYVGETPVQCKPAPTLSEVKSVCITSHANIIEGFPDPPADAWQYGIDATALPPALTEDQQVMWFQCPWVLEEPGSFYTGTLISNFLLNMAAQIQPGVHVCVGIANKFPYVKHYNLEAILGERLTASDNSTPVLEKYQFVGADCELIEELLKFGYHHRSVHDNKDIHGIIIRSHVTLVFKRKLL